MEVSINDLGMVFLYMSAIAFWTIVGMANYKGIKSRILKRKTNKKLDEFIDKLKDDLKKSLQEAQSKTLEKGAKEHANSNREVHTFQWRQAGKMNEVKIIIDPSLDSEISGTREEFEEMVKSGNAGTMEGFLDQIGKVSEKEKSNLKEVREFIFSRKSVEQMAMIGLSPDELVAKMLKAAGRMD